LPTPPAAARADRVSRPPAGRTGPCAPAGQRRAGSPVGPHGPAAACRPGAASPDSCPDHPAAGDPAESPGKPGLPVDGRSRARPGASAPPRAWPTIVGLAGCLVTGEGLRRRRLRRASRAGHARDSRRPPRALAAPRIPGGRAPAAGDARPAVRLAGLPLPRPHGPALGCTVTCLVASPAGAAARGGGRRPSSVLAGRPGARKPSASTIATASASSATTAHPAELAVAHGQRPAAGGRRNPWAQPPTGVASGVSGCPLRDAVQPPRARQAPVSRPRRARWPRQRYRARAAPPPPCRFARPPAPAPWCRTRRHSANARGLTDRAQARHAVEQPRQVPGRIGAGSST
jgi:hypothetical protein